MLLDRIVELSVIKKRIEESVALIERQREIVIESARNGTDTASAQTILDSLILTRSLLEQDLDLLQRKTTLTVTNPD